MAETYHPLTGDGSDFDNVTPYVASSPIGYQDFEWTRQALAMAMYGGFEFFLGGSELPKVTSAWAPVLAPMNRTLDGDNFGNLTKELVCWALTSDAATSVQLRLYDKTNAAALVTGTLVTTTTIGSPEVLAVTMPAGNIEYELQIQGGNTDAGVMGWGFLRLRYVP